MRKKALVAFALANGLFNLAQPAMSEQTAFAPGVVIQWLATEPQVTPEKRAYSLLRLAQQYLQDSGTTDPKSLYFAFRDEHLISFKFGQNAWEICVLRIAKEANATDKLSKAPSAQNLVLANEALHEAVKQLNQSKDVFAKLNLYYAAFGLFKLAKNEVDAAHCHDALNVVIKQCEMPHSPNFDKYADERRPISKVLEMMAFKLVPFSVSDYNIPMEKLKPATEKLSVSRKRFAVYENLKLQSLRILDQLPSENHDRRKAHRDLAIVYEAFGKTKLADQQKQIVYDLVGVHDPTLMYPRSMGCHGLVWWKPANEPASASACGFG